MADKSSLINELLDAMEELLIENQAYKSALKAVEPLFPPQAQGRVELVVRTALADPFVRQTVHQQFAELRDQSPDGTIERLRRLLGKKDVN